VSGGVTAAEETHEQRRTLVELPPDDGLAE
jgi:hypothetical protein